MLNPKGVEIDLFKTFRESPFTPNQKPTRRTARRAGSGAGRRGMRCILRRFTSIKQSLTEVNCGSLPLAISFSFRPTPSCRLSPTCLLQIIPRPQVGGRASSHWFAVAGGDAIRLLLIASPRSLTAFVRYRHDACLLTERMAGRDKRDRSPDEERDELMGHPQVQEKRAGCRHPASLPACLLAYQFLRSRFGYRASFP